MKLLEQSRRYKVESARSSVTLGRLICVRYPSVSSDSVSCRVFFGCLDFIGFLTLMG